jgi:hypothetical protein
MRRLRHDERGVSAVITAIVLVSLMLPVCLITIDVGRVYAERRQLQNGADAAALAVAQSCASTSGCDTSYAAKYANPNANDGTEAVLEVCGTLPKLSACGADPGGPVSKCLPLPANPPKYVQVRTRTSGPGGLVLLPMFGHAAITVSACARATLSGIRTAKGVAFTASYCEWANSTSNGTKFGTQIDISLTGKSCTNPGGGGWGDAPGSFGWLNSDGTCNATIDTTGTYGGDTGNNFPQDCRTVLASYVASGQPIFLPIFDAVQGTGANTVYRFKGWAAFVLLGFDLNGGKAGAKCLRLTKPCMTGYFTQALITDPNAVVGGSSLGADSIGLAG